MNYPAMRLFVLFVLCFFILVTPQLSGQQNKDFYDNDRVAELRLTFKTDAWADDLDSLRVYGNDLLLGTAKIDGKEYKNIGVRYRGQKSFRTGSKRNALHIKLNFIDRNQGHQGYKSIKLSNALRDPSMVREVLGFEIARKYMSAPKANYIKVYVNDAYYGLFVNVESVTDQYLEKNYGSTDNTFFECNPDTDNTADKGCKKSVFANLEYEQDVACFLPNYELMSAFGWDDLINLTKILNQSPDKIASVLNVDRTLWMLAFNNVLVNLSSYSGDNSQNYYLYKGEDGLFNPIIWDLNLAFGSYKNIGSGSDLDLKGLQNLDPLLHINNPSKPLISMLLANENYKKIYLSHIRTILNENFRKGQYLERAKELQKIAKAPFDQDKNGYYKKEDFAKSLTSTVGKKSRIPGIGELMGKRASFLKKHPTLAILPVVVSEVTVESRAMMNMPIQDFKITARVEKYAKKVNILYRFDKNSSFKTAVMNDDGKSNDGKAKDDVYGVKLSPPEGSTEIEYYIMAENKGALTFSPSNYMVKPYTSSLKDLNN